MGLEMDSIKGGSSRGVDIGVLLRWSSFVFVANENSWLRCCSRFAETLTRGGWFPRSYVVADYVTGLISSRPSLAAIRARSLVAPLRDFAPCCRRTRSLDQTASIVRSQIATTPSFNGNQAAPRLNRRATRRMFAHPPPPPIRECTITSPLLFALMLDSTRFYGNYA